jgi:peptidoglycan/xylan/chitin deacetylase (PgdA/CDA1 family)
MDRGMTSDAYELADTPWVRRKANLAHRFAHIWPRGAKLWVPDLWIRLPETPQSDAREKFAALTFDDGPTDRGTPKLLDVLAKWNVSATFFLLGENVRALPERARSLVEAGHAVGNHFRRHIDSLKSSKRTIVREVTEGSRILQDVLGVSPAWCRPPFGFLTHTLVKWSRIHQQQVVLWDVFPPDYMPWSTPDSLQRVLVRKLVPRSIVCLHDNLASANSTPAMLRSALPRLLDQGWRFVALPRPVQTVSLEST